MKKVLVSEMDIRAALGLSGYSPLADSLVNKLFSPTQQEKIRTLEERLETVEKKLNEVTNIRPRLRLT